MAQVSPWAPEAPNLCPARNSTFLTDGRASIA